LSWSSSSQKLATQMLVRRKPSSCAATCCRKTASSRPVSFAYASTQRLKWRTASAISDVSFMVEIFESHRVRVWKMPERLSRSV